MFRKNKSGKLSLFNSSTMPFLLRRCFYDMNFCAVFLSQDVLCRARARKNSNAHKSRGQIRFQQRALWVCAVGDNSNNTGANTSSTRPFVIRRLGNKHYRPSRVAQFILSALAAAKHALNLRSANILLCFIRRRL